MQLELAGALAVPDGRYLARSGREGGESVLVVETLSSAPRRLRRRAAAGASPATPPLARVTAVRAFEPFAAERDAAGWLAKATGPKGEAEELIAEAVSLLNRALHAHAIAGADPYVGGVCAERSLAVRIGYGSGAELAAGRFTAAREIDVGRGGGPSRRRREDSLRSGERAAAVLAGKERIDTCETLLLRARADLDGGRVREAALQLDIGLKALLAELPGAVADPGHEQDMRVLGERQAQAGAAAGAALRGELDAGAKRSVGELLELCERVLRRRRVLRS